MNLNQFLSAAQVAELEAVSKAVAAIKSVNLKGIQPTTATFAFNTDLLNRACKP